MLLGDFIQTINKYLTNLEYLGISELDNEIQPTQLDHVQHVSINGANSPIERLSFPRLKSFKMIYGKEIETGGARNSWVAFFENHQYLETLNCTVYEKSGLADFLAMLPNLSKLNLKFYYNGFDIGLVSQLTENHKNLMELQYQVNLFDYPNEPELQLYHEKFGNDWHISYYKDGAWLTLKLVAKN